jgi:hypothetical protein
VGGGRAQRTGAEMRVAEMSQTHVPSFGPPGPDDSAASTTDERIAAQAKGAQSSLHLALEPPG